ncbi:methyl-accepting chemotaxis protein [Gracilibacillus saliphilus]|uniref:methyl-accepting chemotaxis protein n=1 Tax=Gracilibacillus saliphilus TaxID=543890 RepID=UPI0013D6174C|nr:methyl-accepting chemotaxis protein [Gracilibacillus saliphilus]
MNSSLQAVVNIAPIIKETIGPTSAMGIIDTEKFVYFEPSTVLNLDVAVGTPAIPDIEQYARAIKGEKFSDTTLDPTIFGAPVVTDILPIKDDSTNEIVGLLSLSRTLEHKVRLDKEMDKINKLIDGLQGKVQHVAAQAEQLSATSNEISEQATHANDNSKHIGEVVQLIDQISNQTNLLGLNAAIEAARSGEAGKGFSLVADKIRKLSDNTRNAVKTIDTSLSEIRSSNENLTLSIKEVSSSSEEQSKIMVEFMDDIQNLDNKSKKIVSLMKNITNQN